MTPEELDDVARRGMQAANGILTARMRSLDGTGTVEEFLRVIDMEAGEHGAQDMLCSLATLAAGIVDALAAVGGGKDRYVIPQAVAEGLQKGGRGGAR